MLNRKFLIVIDRSSSHVAQHTQGTDVDIVLSQAEHVDRHKEFNGLQAKRPKLPNRLKQGFNSKDL